MTTKRGQIWKGLGMLRRLSRTSAVLAASILLVLGTLGGVAAAKSAGVIKNAKPDPKPLVTEDNDDNDGGTPNNVVDDGDNAHPSGKDRSVEHGNSGNQGNAQSDPDDDGHGPDRSNGGADQPGGPGGVDKADQDGNNGCGNDDDFEDDNEGWCGQKPHDTYVGGETPKLHGYDRP
jgi:hypothetical protein